MLSHLILRLVRLHEVEEASHIDLDTLVAVGKGRGSFVVIAVLIDSDRLGR